MNNFTKNLEESVKEVNQLIKDKKINHPAVCRLIKNLMIYDYYNDILMAESEIANGELTYMLELYKKLFPNAYFIKSEKEVMMINSIPESNIIIRAEY